MTRSTDATPTEILYIHEHDSDSRITGALTLTLTVSHASRLTHSESQMRLTSVRPKISHTSLMWVFLFTALRTSSSSSASERFWSKES